MCSHRDWDRGSGAGYGRAGTCSCDGCGLVGERGVCVGVVWWCGGLSAGWSWWVGVPQPSCGNFGRQGIKRRRLASQSTPNQHRNPGTRSEMFGLTQQTLFRHEPPRQNSGRTLALPCLCVVLNVNHVRTGTASRQLQPKSERFPSDQQIRYLITMPAEGKTHADSITAPHPLRRCENSNRPLPCGPLPSPRSFEHLTIGPMQPSVLGSSTPSQAALRAPAGHQRRPRPSSHLKLPSQPPLTSSHSARLAACSLPPPNGPAQLPAWQEGGTNKRALFM